MSAARALGFIYLVMASVFGVAIALHQHPDWQKSASGEGVAVLRLADDSVVRPAAHASLKELTALFDSIDPPIRVARVAKAPLIARATKPTVVAAIPIPHRDIVLHETVGNTTVASLAPPATPEIAAPPAQPPLSAPPALRPLLDEDDTRTRVAMAAPPAPAPAPIRHDAAKPVLLPPSNMSAPLAPAELTRVVARLKQNLTPEMLANFELFLYVSKAEHGPWAQHMYVFAKADSGDLSLKYNWLVSTGRDQVEFNDAGVRLPTYTPQGYYQIDPQRVYRHYTSSQWHQPMPFAMFFNWIKNGDQTGLAIHSATGGDVALLGQRASAGCIRLSPANAATLFGLVRSQYRGLAPRFAMDRRTGTMSNDGILMHDVSGHVRLAEGYKVLIFIENYGGDENVVAALY